MRKIIISAILILLSVVSVYSQSRTSYFVRNSTQNHNFNAAFVPDQGYIGVPILSNFDLQTSSNLGALSILYPLEGGQTCLFLNSQVSSEEFLSKLRKNNYLDATFSYDVINAGWFTGKDSFWTIAIGERVDMQSSLPREFFSLLKNGMYDNPSAYSIENMGVGATLYSQISLGYSRGLDELVEGLRVGGKFKLLLSMADVQMNIDRMDISMSSDSWSAATTGSASVLGGGIDLMYDENNNLSSVGYDPSSMGIGGAGIAFDLGAEYILSEGTPVDGMRFSLSVTDLGFVSYGKKRSRLLSSEGNIVFDGFEDIGVDGSGVNTDSMMEDLMSMAAFKEEPVTKNQVRSLTATLYAGVDYPFLDDKMNVGLLYSARFGRFRTESELTLAWNYAPVRSFDIALSYSLLKTHSTFGWLITYVPKRGVGIFVGSDYTPLNYTALKVQGVKLPVPAREFVLDVNFGLTISLGGSNRRY